MITTYEDNAAYVAAGMPTDESRVALIKDTNEVKIDGINVVTSEPEKGDVLFIDASGKKIFLKGGAELNASLIPAGWTWIGVVISRKGNKVKILDKANSSSMQWLACWQYAITAISSTSITIKVRMSNNYGAYTDVPVTLTSAAVNAQSASEISAAIAAKATAVGDTSRATLLVLIVQSLCRFGKICLQVLLFGVRMALVRLMAVRISPVSLLIIAPTEQFQRLMLTRMQQLLLSVLVLKTQKMLHMLIALICVLSTEHMKHTWQTSA